MTFAESDDVRRMLMDALRQRDQMMYRNPADEKYAEWHIHPQTFAALRHHDAERDADPRTPRIHLGAIQHSYEPGVDARLFGYIVRVSSGVEPGRIHLSCETELDATVRHARERGETVHIMPPVVMDWGTPPPPTPTAKALVKHWTKRLRKKVGR